MAGEYMKGEMTLPYSFYLLVNLLAFTIWSISSSSPVGFNGSNLTPK